MNKLFFPIIFFLLIINLSAESISSIPSESISENITIKPKVIEKEETNVDLLTKKDYFKISASFLIANTGYGIRNYNFKDRSATDHFMSTYFLPFKHTILSGVGLSYKFSRINYKKNTFPSWYNGVGYEICAIVPFKLSYPIFVPNIELFLGKENFYKKVKFTQFGINLLPFGLWSYHFIKPSETSGFLALFSTAILLNFSIGF